MAGYQAAPVSSTSPHLASAAVSCSATFGTTAGSSPTRCKGWIAEQTHDTESQHGYGVLALYASLSSGVLPHPRGQTDHVVGPQTRPAPEAADQLIVAAAQGWPTVPLKE